MALQKCTWPIVILVIELIKGNFLFLYYAITFEKTLELPVKLEGRFVPPPPQKGAGALLKGQVSELLSCTETFTDLQITKNQTKRSKLHLNDSFGSNRCLVKVKGIRHHGSNRQMDKLRKRLPG